MEPSFFFSYWRPWKEDSSFIDSWGDYLRDTSLVRFGAEQIGKHIQQASHEQIEAIREASHQQVAAIQMQTMAMAKIGEAQAMEIRNAAKYIGYHLKDVQQEISFLNRRMDIALEQQRLGLVLQNNIAQLLKIPDSEKERQQAITLGIQFFVNASKDADLFDDALEEFLKAEQMKKQDFFVLHRIGCIYLYTKKHLNPQLALDYFTRAGKYASVESSPDALRLVNLLTNSINAAYTKQTSDPQQIKLLAANSYEKAALASYILGDDKGAVAFQEKALIYDKSAKNAFSMAKYLIRSGQTAKAIKQLEWAIKTDPVLIDAVFGDVDIAGAPETIELVIRKNSELDNHIEEAILDSFQQKRDTAQEDQIKAARLELIANIGSEQSYVEKEKAYCAFINTSDKAINKRVKDGKKIQETLKKYNALGIISNADYSHWMTLLSEKIAESFDEYSTICNNAQLFINKQTLSVGQKVKGGVVFNVDSKGRKGLMCANHMISVKTFSRGLPDFVIMTLFDDDGESNTKQLSKAEYYCRAANECSYPIDGLQGWYIPSKNELDMVFKAVPREVNSMWPEGSFIWTSSGARAVDLKARGWGIVVRTRKEGFKVTSKYDSYFGEGCILPIRKINLD